MAIFIDCNTIKNNELNNEITEKISKKLPKSINDNLEENKLKNIDTYLQEIDSIIILILQNYESNINIDFLFGLKNVRIICTLDNLFIKISSEFVKRFNFIFRDMTTFVKYDVIDVEEVSVVYNVLLSVTKRQRNVFRRLLEVLEGEYIESKDLVMKVGKRLLIGDVRKVNEALGEFYDHGVLKKGKDGRVVVNMKRKEIDEVLNNWTY